MWSYSPISDFELDSFRPCSPTSDAAGLDARISAFMSELDARVPQRSATVLIQNGYVSFIHVQNEANGLSIRSVGDDDVRLLGSVLDGGDLFARMNEAFLPDAIVVEVFANVVLDHPVVVVNWSLASDSVDPIGQACFPRIVVRLGENAQASVVEIIAGGAQGGEKTLVVPVTELDVDDRARLSYVALQSLDSSVWSIGYLSGRAGQDATVSTFTMGLGGAYVRCRTDIAVTGTGASSKIKSVYLGTDEQVHDIRTKQDHCAPHTTSDLLCKGAVAGSSRSIYSGLIRVRNGAVHTEAMQTNNNLILDEHAHADSVPNLDIEESDVRCSHASTIGTLDDDQRYYLESRGVMPEQAERLIVLGFFDDIIDQSPIPEVVEMLRDAVGTKLNSALGIKEIDKEIVDA